MSVLSFVLFVILSHRNTSVSDYVEQSSLLKPYKYILSSLTFTVQFIPRPVMS